MVAETALAIFFATGVKGTVSFATIAVLGTIAAVLGISSFAYGMHVQDQAEKAKEQLKLIET